VNLGPGVNAQAHQPNEYTTLSLLTEGYQIFERFLGALATAEGAARAGSP
jgi:acetylornithine deacetylase/succinyl-diaminopimelate desuccinylase-like protein